MSGAAGFLIAGVANIALGLVDALELIIFIWVITSWLIAFDVVNIRNPTVRKVVGLLDGVMAPLTRPFRRFIPNLGPVDLSPLALIVCLELVKLGLRTLQLAVSVG